MTDWILETIEQYKSVSIILPIVCLRYLKSNDSDEAGSI